MPALLAPVNFNAAKNAYPVIYVPEGETMEVEAVSKEWLPEDNKAGDGQHILAKYTVNFEGHLVTNKGTDAAPDWQPSDETVNRSIEFRIQWPLKETGLWRTKKDLVALDVDPADLEGDAVDLESILNELFSSPHKALLKISMGLYTPQGYDPLDSTSPQPRMTNNVVGIRAAA